jgi:hypothetical protein
MRMMLPLMAPTSKRRVYTSLLVWKYPTFRLPMVGLTDLRNTTVLTEIYQVKSVDSETVENW